MSSSERIQITGCSVSCGPEVRTWAQRSAHTDSHGHTQAQPLKVHFASVRQLIFSPRHDKMISGLVQPDSLLPLWDSWKNWTCVHHRAFPHYSEYPLKQMYQCLAPVACLSGYVRDAADVCAPAVTDDYSAAIFIVLHETQFPSSSETIWVQHLPPSIRGEGWILLYERQFVPDSLQCIADALHLCESILPPFVARVLLPQLCSALLMI